MGAEIAVREAQLVAQEPSVGALMQQVVAAGITPETAQVMKDLIAMKIQLEDRDAAKQFTGDPCTQLAIKNHHEHETQ